MTLPLKDHAHAPNFLRQGSQTDSNPAAHEHNLPQHTPHTQTTQQTTHTGHASPLPQTFSWNDALIYHKEHGLDPIRFVGRLASPRLALMLVLVLVVVVVRVTTFSMIQWHPYIMI